MPILALPLERAFLRRKMGFVRRALIGREGTKEIGRLPISHTVVFRADAKKDSALPIDIKRSVPAYKPTTFQPLPTFSRPAFSFQLPKRVQVGLFGSLVAACLLALAVLFFPDVYYRIFPAESVPVEFATTGTPIGGDFKWGTSTRQIVLPPYDATLPEGNWIIIPRIGVRTEILESADPDVSLNKGVWRVPDFGHPGEFTKPIILTAHRYGWLSWWKKSQYWRYHSFYLLPTLEPGDLVEVISNKRKYTYEVYGGEEGEQISDYQADLILYTCKLLNSPIRFFRYARLINPNKNTQVAK
jgi:hypothetical protein